MALTLAILNGNSAQSVVAGQPVTFLAAVTNAGATSVTLQALQTSTDGTGSVSITQPDWLTSNVPVGVGNPILLPATTYYYPFRVVFLSPANAGPSPQAVGGGWTANGAAYPLDSDFGLNVMSVSSDGTVAFASTAEGVLATNAPFPVPLGGALQLNSSMNLVNRLACFP